MNEMFAVLADPTRRQIIELLAERERSLAPEMQKQTRVYAQAVDIAFEYALHDLDPGRVQDFIDRLSADPQIFGVLLYAADGSLRYASDSLTGAAAAVSASPRSSASTM